MASEGELVFVYGTLRRGASNAWRMDGAEWLDAGEVKGRLYRIDWYPGLVLDAAGGRVAGDLWRVTSEHLAALDAFEGASTEEVEGAEYRRVRARILGVDPAMSEAWVWEWRGPQREADRIAGGDWLAANGVA